jgi:hypothetical protein
MDSLYREIGSDLDVVMMPAINTRLEGATSWACRHPERCAVMSAAHSGLPRARA